MSRRINAAGLAHLKRWEGCKLTAYKDVAGVLTIGYGSTGKHVRPGMKISQAAAEQLLKDDLTRFESAVERLVTVQLNDNQFAALVAFAFNVGIGAFEESTLLRKLNDGNYPVVPFELMKWVNAGGKKVQGLVNRRKAEGDLFRSAKATQPTPIPPRKPAQPSVALPGPVEAGWLSRLLAALLAMFKKG